MKSQWVPGTVQYRPIIPHHRCLTICQGLELQSRSEGGGTQVRLHVRESASQIGTGPGEIQEKCGSAHFQCLLLVWSEIYGYQEIAFVESDPDK